MDCPIEKLARQLQGLAGHHRWAVADSELIQAIALQRPVFRGQNGRLLHRIVRVMSLLKIQWLVAFLVAVVQLLRIRSRRSENAKEMPQVWFVGFGAAAETLLHEKYSSQSGCYAEQIDQTEFDSMTAWIQPTRLNLMRAAWRSANEARNAISLLPSNLQPYHNHFWTFIAIRLPHYSFHFAWFSELRKRMCGNPHEVCFLSADTPAFAAVDAGMPVRFQQHGFVRKSLIMPAFNSIDALTLDEASHFQMRCGEADVSQSSLSQLDGPKNDSVLVAGIRTSNDVIREFSEIADWAKTSNLKVILRPHPTENAENWSACRDHYDVEIGTTQHTFEEAIARIRPKFVVTWFSTAAADALQCGVLPVTVSNPDDPAYSDLVYPLFDRTLHLKKDRHRIENAIACENLYGTELERLGRVIAK